MSSLTWSLYDNTLRDGEQTPGVCFSAEQKVAIARQLAQAGMPALEAGFAGISYAEQNAIAAVVRQVSGPRIYSLARLCKSDIEAAVKTKVDGVTLFAPSSDSLMTARGITSEIVLEQDISRMVTLAKQRGLLVRFSCEDASRAPLPRLLRFYHAARQAGADWISYADTTGVAVPEKIAQAVRKIRRVLDVPLSVHCHNDLGLAVANSIAAVRAGAREVQVTLNGLGERAGNTAAEEFIMAMRVGYGAKPGIDLKVLMELSGYLSWITGLEPGFNKPIIGKHAFRHESGIHVHGLLQTGLQAYEPFPPAWVGRKHEVVFGKHSGKSNLRFLCREFGLFLDPRQESGVAAKIKHIAQTERRPLAQAEVLQLLTLAGVRAR